MIGQTLSHYRILKELGRGGMGIVYKAEDAKLNRTVALKVLPQYAVSDADDVARFNREAQAAAALNHPHIATIHEIDEVDGQSFIVMEYVDGPSLKEKINEGPLELNEALRIAIQFISGLEAAHELGIVHRDIKPANIMLTRKGETKIMDFGLAKLAGQTTLTKTGMTVGTAAYMSPEQARGETVDHRSDIFSAGVVFYEMVTGKRAFKGEYEQAVIYSILNVEPDSISELKESVPADLERIVNRALSKNADHRYQAATDFLSELSSILDSSDSEQPTSVGAVSASGSETAAKRFSKNTVLIFAGTLIMAVIALYLLYGGGPKSSRITLGRAQQITYLPGMEIDPAISPNGELIAFASGALGRTNIYVRQFAGGRTISLTEDLPGPHRWPQWSPDGQRIAFESSLSLYVVPALGGVPRKLLDVEPGSIGLSSAWSPDGSQIAYVEGNAIFIHAIADNQSVRLADAFLPHSLSWSPDGTRIAFVSDNQRYIFGALSFANVAPSSIWVVRLSDGEVVPVTGTESLNLSPVWTPDSRALLFISDQDGTRDIYRLNNSSSGKPEGALERLTTGLNAHTISLSRDGQKLAYSVFTSNQNIWSIPVPMNGPVSVSEAEPVTRGHQTIEMMSITQDKQWMVYDSDLMGNQDLFKMRLPDGDPIQLTTNPADDFTPSWSFDGSEVAFHSFRDGNREIYLIDSEGRTPVRLTDSPAQDRVAVWSPGGNRIVFFSDASGTQQLYIITRPNRDEPFGSPRQLTTTGGLHSSWSPDGKSIAYITGSHQHIMSTEALRAGADIARRRRADDTGSE